MSMAKGGPDCVLQTNRIIVPLEWEVHGRPVTLGGPKILSSVASGRGKAACEAKRAAPVVEHGGMLWHALGCTGSVVLGPEAMYDAAAPVSE
jgi:hypothetical protein